MNKCQNDRPLYESIVSQLPRLIITVRDSYARVKYGLESVNLFVYISWSPLPGCCFRFREKDGRSKETEFALKNLNFAKMQDFLESLQIEHYCDSLQGSRDWITSQRSSGLAKKLGCNTHVDVRASRHLTNAQRNFKRNPKITRFLVWERITTILTPLW